MLERVIDQLAILSKLGIDESKAFYRDVFEKLRADVKYIAFKGSLGQDVLHYANPLPLFFHAINKGHKNYLFIALC